jgi:tetratricopeptide (TPR) repeat protein
MGENYKVGTFEYYIHEAEDILDDFDPDHVLSESDLEDLLNAEKALERAQSIDSKNATSYLLFAEIHLLRKEYDLALDIMCELEKKHPKNSDIPRKIGKVYIKQDKSKDALFALQRAYYLEPNCPAINHSLGDVLYDAGKIDDALRHYKKTEELCDELLPGLFVDLSYCYSSLGEMEIAHCYLKKALQLDPEDADIHLGLADLHLDCGDLDDAKTAITKSLDIDPKCEEALKVKKKICKAISKQREKKAKGKSKPEKGFRPDEKNKIKGEFDVLLDDSSILDDLSQ